jgi:O-acetylhomoserine (thiol)-lyase
MIGNFIGTASERNASVAALEGGPEALCVSTGQAAVNYAIPNLTGLGTNIISAPQLYGTTQTLFAHILPTQGVTVRFAESDRPCAIEKLIDDNTRGVFCESVGNPAGNICDIEALARVAHKNGVPLVIDNTVATPILLRPIEYGTDIVVHSLTKFMDTRNDAPERWHRTCRRYHRRPRSSA